MGLLENIRVGLKFRNLHLIAEAIRKIRNWPSYFLDFLCITRKDNITYRMKNGLVYFVRARTSDRAIITTVHLADEYKIDRLSLPQDSVVIDIGAQIGVFSVYASRKAGKIFSYEPVPDNYRMLLKNINMNNMESKIRPFNLAVSDKIGTVKIFTFKDNTGAHSMYGKGEHIEAAATTLKDIIDRNKIEQCDLLKIDAEGAEYNILYALPKEYFKRIKRIYLEYHDLDRENKNHESLKKFLEENGFTVIHKFPYLFAERA